MTELFNKQDVLTLLTAGKDIIGAEGYFGDSIRDLTKNVERGDVKTLIDINADDGYCFGTRKELRYYLFFLPKDKVKVKKSYRPFNSIDELFDFFYPPKDTIYNSIEKAESLLGKKLVLRKLENDQIKVMVIQDIEFNNTNGNIYLNNLSLDCIFNAYDIEKDSQWVPFGVKEE